MHMSHGTQVTRIEGSLIVWREDHTRHKRPVVNASFIQTERHRIGHNGIEKYIQSISVVWGSSDTIDNISWHDMTWHDMTWHDMTWHDMTKEGFTVVLLQWQATFFLWCWQMGSYDYCIDRKTSLFLLFIQARPWSKKPNSHVCLAKDKGGTVSW